MTFAENFLGGHIRIGPITIYGANAMYWATNIKTRWGYICFRPLSKIRYGRWIFPYFYISPDATPTNATYWLYGKE